MAHPFERIFDTALRESRDGDNELVTAVQNLVESGYAEGEVIAALKHFSHGLLQDSDIDTANAALDSLEGSLKQDV